MLFALGLMVVTLVGHAAAQGALPDRTGLAAMTALALVTSAAVMSRKRSTLVVFTYLLVGQIALHMVASTTGAHTSHGVHGSVTFMVATHTLLALALTFVALHMDRIVAALQILGRTLLGRHVVALRVNAPAPRFFADTASPLTSYLGYSPHSRRGPPISACA